MIRIQLCKHSPLRTDSESWSKKNGYPGKTYGSRGFCIRHLSASMPASRILTICKIEKSIKKTIQTLSTGMFIARKLNVVISGKTGSGKSFLACDLGNNACRQGYTVKYFRIPELLLEIQDAKNENRYTRFMDQMQKVKLLILDDISLQSYPLEESRDILEVAERRYNKASTILSGQIPHTQWYDLFPDPTLADGIMDRVIHNAYILALDSKISMREVMAEKIIKEINQTDS